MTYLHNKRTLSVRSANKLCPLTHNQVLVLSYLLYQDRWQHVPSFAAIAEATGLDPETVSRCCTVLREHGLADDDNRPDVTQHYEWFSKRRTKDKHQASVLRWWNCYVREPHSPIRQPAVSVWSFLLDCLTSGFQPNSWSIAYLAACLKMSPETVESALDALQEHSFLTWERQPFKVVLKQSLGVEQLAMLADKPKRPSASTGQLMFDGDHPDNDLALPGPIADTPVVESHIETFDIFEALEPLGVSERDRHRFIHWFGDDLKARLKYSDDYKAIIQQEYEKWRERELERQKAEVGQAMTFNGHIGRNGSTA